MDAIAAPIRVGAQQALSASPALPPLENREVVFGIRGGSVHYGSHLALKDVDIDIYRNFVTALHRAVRLRQVDVPALPEPHERPDPGARR